MTDHAKTTAPTLKDVEEALRGQPHRWLDVGHCELASWSFGQGPDLLFVHGWPLTAATFREHIPHLADAFTCHLIDLPGIGKTRWDKKRTQFGVEGHISAVVGAIEALNLEKVALVAHDSGATITRVVASRLPEKVTALVMGDTELPGHHVTTFEMLQKALSMPGASTAMRAAWRSERLLRSKYGFASCFVNKDLIMGDFHRWFVAPLTQNARAMDGQLHFVRGADWSILDRLPQIHAQIAAPVLMIWGERDRFFPLSGARKMIDQFPAGATLEVIPEGRLFVHEEHPERFVQLTRDFLLEHT